MELLYAPEEVQSDRCLVRSAVRQSGDALAIAAEELRNDKELVLQAAPGPRVYGFRGALGGFLR